MSITDLQGIKRFILDAHALSVKSARELKTVHGDTVASMNKKMMKEFWLICKGAGANKANRWAMPCTCRQLRPFPWTCLCGLLGRSGRSRVTRSSRGGHALPAIEGISAVS